MLARRTTPWLRRVPRMTPVSGIPKRTGLLGRVATYSWSDLQLHR